MAAIDFPNSPTQGDTFTASDKTWVYLDGKWTLPSVDANGLVTSISSATSGQFLKWNGSAWVNDTIDLGADTAGSFVASLVAGTGVSVTNNSGEAATPTIALDATLDNLSNVTVPSPTTNDVLQWNGTAWVNVAASTVGATNLDGLSDVVIATPEEFQTLEYNGTNWVNAYASTVTYVRNAEATTLTTGTVVYLFGATGDHATVKRADKASDTTSSKTVGVIGANIASSQNGPVITRGYVDGIDLSVGYSSGDILWLGSNGQFTKTKAVAPDHLVFVGVVVRATNNGIIYVATQNGYELDELHNVNASSPNSGDFLKYNGSLWVNDAIDLGTDTTGNYVATISGTANQISVTGSGSESAAVTIGLPSDVTISNDLTVTGNLTVNGTTTTLNTETLAVEDNIIVLNNNVTGAPSTNAGIEVERGSSTNVQLRWNETTDKWQFTNDGSTYTDLGAGGASISDTPPASPVPGQIWFESDTAKTFVYFDSQWIEIGALAAAGIVTMSDTAPASPADGKLWFNSSTAKTYVYYDSAWVEIGAGSNPAALNDIGDVTITSASSGQFLRWDGAAWVNKPITTTTTRTNLVTNPNFETDTTGWASAQSSAVRSTDYAYIGTASYKVTMSSTTDSNVAAIGTSFNSFTTTGTFTVSAYCYVPTGSTIAGRTITISFEGGTATGTQGTSSPATLVAGSWVRVSRPFTVTATGTKAIVFRLSGTLSTAVGQIVYIDSTLSELQSSALPYFDGTYADAYTGYTLTSRAWTGTANASTSTATWAETSSVFLDDIADVTITSATSGQTLQWNGSAWVNAIGFSGDSKQSILGNQIFG